MFTRAGRVPRWELASPHLQLKDPTGLRRITHLLAD